MTGQRQVSVDALVVDPDTGRTYTHHADGTYSSVQSDGVVPVHPAGPLAARLEQARADESIGGAS